MADKRSLIEARDQVEQLKVDLALAFAEAQKLLDGALLQEPDNAAAKAALVELWRDRLADAERRRDKADVAYALVMIERHGDEPVPSDGTLALTSDPAGADVVLYRYEEVDGVLTPSDEKHLGMTPLGPVTLPMGSYLCVLKKEGFRDTRYPVHITRECRWQDEVKLRTDAEIGEGFAYVPAGPFVYGEGFEQRLPVVAISYDDAEAYCRWKAETTGREWCLPTEEEREKAARGVDGRRFAWGDLEDASLGKCRESREMPAQPEPVGAFPTAESVYGMGDASGGVWDWTSSWEDERRSWRVLRGGSWDYRPVHLRAAARGTYLPRVRLPDVGVRCARGFSDTLELWPLSLSAFAV